MSNRKGKAVPINRNNIRRINGGFSWLEHRFIVGRYIDIMDTKEEILLYFFLVAVGDSKGVSFYSSERMASLLHICVISIEEAVEGLVDKGFIAYSNGVYQVLNLPLMMDKEQEIMYAAKTMGRNKASLFK